MIMVLSRFTVVEGMEEKVREAFLARPHLVDQADGFIRMEVRRPQESPTEFWLMTWWHDESSYLAWHQSHAYHESHEFMPKGLKLVPGKTSITMLEKIAD